MNLHEKTPDVATAAVSAPVASRQVAGSPVDDAPAISSHESDTSSPGRRPRRPRRRHSLGDVWLRVLAVLLVAGFASAWTAMVALEELTEEETATELWEAGLRPPTELAIALALAEQAAEDARHLRADQDLVGFVLTPEEVEADMGAVVDRLVSDRATRLYEEGPPPDPGATRRSFTGVPRVVLAQLTAERHEQAPTAAAAALVGLGAGVLTGFVAGGIAGGLWLVGLGALVAWALTSVQTWALRSLVETSSPVGQRFAASMGDAAAPHIELLLFAGIAFCAAGLIYRLILR